MDTLEHGTPAALTSARALRNAGVYAFFAALHGAVGFLLLPLYTRVLSPGEYGRLAIILTITTAASIIFSLGFDFAVLRNFFQLVSNPTEQRRLVDSMWTFLIVTSLVAAVILSAAITPWLSSTTLIRPGELILALVAAALYVSATTVPLSLMRAQERLRDYIVLSFTFAGATAVATLILVVGFDAGVQGWLLAMVFANLVTFTAACRIIPWRLPHPFDRPLVRDGLILGLPLIPHFLGHWALMLADRGVLGGLVSTTDVGIYTLGATLALPALILVQGLAQAFNPSYAAAATDESRRAELSGLVSVQAVAVLVICLSVALLGPIVVGVVTPPAYHGAAPLIPWIALGYAFLGLYCIPMSSLSLGMGRTKFVWIATAAAAATNISLIYLLVPRHGILFAAVASAIGYLVLLLAIFWHSRDPLNPLTYEWSRLLRAVAVIGVVYVAAVLTTEDAGIVSAVVRTIWLALAAVALVASGCISATRVRALVTRLRPL